MDITSSYEKQVQDISDDRLEAVVQSIDVVKRDIDGFGAEIFTTLFKEHPEYLSLFTRLRDIPRDQLEDNIHFKRHAKSVVTAVAHTVTNLRNSSLVLPELERLGVEHLRRKVQPEQFTAVNGVILKVISGKVSDPEILATWKEILNIISNFMIFYMKQ
uniref:Globin-1 n=1 Tax=Cacopsylla melanoneura TaxID=428564 RepID=A0A8D9FK70_9HEMI